LFAVQNVHAGLHEKCPGKAFAKQWTEYFVSLFSGILILLFLLIKVKKGLLAYLTHYCNGKEI